MSALARTATLIEELVEYDGPQLLLLKTSRKRHMLAAAIRHERMQEPFFGCEINDKTYDLYFDQIADLHYAFQRAIGGNYYLFDLAIADKAESMPLKRVADDEARNPHYWPQVGFFARSHTTTFNRSSASGETKAFKIDGRWGASDFSHFHAKMSDLYALFGVLGRLGGAHGAAERGFIRQVIQDRFWQGGGSYVGFYDSLFDRNKRLQLARLEVAKIQYASPGEIILRGNKKALSDVTDLLDIFDGSWKTLTTEYNKLRGALRKENLLGAGPSTSFSTLAMEKFIQVQAEKFAENMELDHANEIYEACEKNTLVFAKVVLSIFRRANELYTYHAEGRIQRID